LEAADWFEREVYDMFGITFDGHPNMRRLLVHHQFVGWPLRKDYPADQQQHCTEALPIHFDNEPIIRPIPIRISAAQYRSFASGDARNFAGDGATRW